MKNFAEDFGKKENSKLCKGVENSTGFHDVGILLIENMIILKISEIHLVIGVGQRLYDFILEYMTHNR